MLLMTEALGQLTFRGALPSIWGLSPGLPSTLSWTIKPVLFC